MDKELLAEHYIQEGNCCTAAILRAAMELKGCGQQEDLVQAASGLCGGIHAGQNCGALTGGAMMLSLFDRAAAASFMIPELVEWFDSVYGMEYGSINCEDIAGPDRRHKAERCRPLINAVYRKCLELLEEYLSDAGRLPGEW